MASRNPQKDDYLPLDPRHEWTEPEQDVAAGFLQKCKQAVNYIWLEQQQGVDVDVIRRRQGFLSDSRRGEQQYDAEKYISLGRLISLLESKRFEVMMVLEGETVMVRVFWGKRLVKYRNEGWPLETMDEHTQAAHHQCSSRLDMGLETSGAWLRCGDI